GVRFGTATLCPPASGDGDDRRDADDGDPVSRAVVAQMLGRVAEPMILEAPQHCLCHLRRWPELIVPPRQEQDTPLDLFDRDGSLAGVLGIMQASPVKVHQVGGRPAFLLFRGWRRMLQWNESQRLAMIGP